ncbi:response regulator [Asticcacaulis biprosthecium C19]|uniref:Response regulator n=1 Tax=Asticcacaulis biprosthecium C19 TaxID=715226 RepID=F4QNX4_9CAUL|nr:response regulator [Asticcacaulis biprosthecium]EGF91032.1 response regulator [Asticcacaulis biprosthecium C19]
MLNILIVEDDLMIADMTEAFLIASGYDVCGIARTVNKALALAAEHLPDLALIDLRLAEGGLGTDVAPQLQRRKRTGILYVSGNAMQFDLTSDDGDGCLVKPYLTRDLLCSLSIVTDIVTTGASTQIHPRGFKLLKPPIPDGIASHG